MRVGLTYDLRSEYLAQGYSELETAEFDRDDTIEAIEAALQSFGCETDRIGNARRLIERLAAGDRWNLVFNIAEGLSGFARESQVPAILDVYDIPYTFSDGYVLALSLHKGAMKRFVRDLGVPTPDFEVVEAEEDAARVDLPFPLFAKPVAEGTGKGVTSASLARTRAELTRTCRRLLREYRQPVLVETYMPGREFTVGILGTGRQAVAAGVMEVIFREDAEKGAYSYSNKKRYEEFIDYRLVADPEAQAAADAALAAWRGLGARDAGRADLRSDAHGRPHFLEVNPLAGLNPESSDLCILCSKAGISYTALIGRIVDSACARNGIASPCGALVR